VRIVHEGIGAVKKAANREFGPSLRVLVSLDES
jgi:hypothetical protein